MQPVRTGWRPNLLAQGMRDDSVSTGIRCSWQSTSPSTVPTVRVADELLGNAVSIAGRGASEGKSNGFRRYKLKTGRDFVPPGFRVLRPVASTAPRFILSRFYLVVARKSACAPRAPNHLPGDGVVHSFKARPGLRVKEGGAATAPPPDSVRTKGASRSASITCWESPQRHRRWRRLNLQHLRRWTPRSDPPRPPDRPPDIG